MTSEQAQAQINRYASKRGISPLDAYYEIQELCEAHQGVWELGFEAGQDFANSQKEPT